MMLPVTQIARSLICKNAGVLSRAYGGANIYHRTPSHNDLPVPQGDWYEKYQKTQARYNTQLAGSVLLFVGVVVYIKKTKVIDFNWSPPSTYE